MQQLWLCVACVARLLPIALPHTLVRMRLCSVDGWRETAVFPLNLHMLFSRVSSSVGATFLLA